MARGRGSKLARTAVLALAVSWGAAAPCPAAARAEGLPGKWVEVRSPHFVVAGNGGRRPARDVAEQFEQIRALFAQALPGSVPESGPPLHVFAVGDERTLKRLVPEYWEERQRARPAGVFRSTPTGTHVVVRADLLGGEDYSIVYHEYFHFLAHGARWELPVWASEGLATFWGNTRLTAQAAEVGRPAVALLDRLRTGPFLPLAELMAVEHSSPHYLRSGKKEQFYAQSWALVHYLYLGDRSGRRREQLADYLRRIAAGEPGARAASAAFGDLEALESELRAYTRKLLLPVARLAAPAPLAEDRFQVRDLPPAEAAARGALFRLDGGGTEGVEALVAFALAGAPDLADAQAASGVLRALEGDHAAAEQAFERATRLAGATALAHYGLAVVTFHRDSSPASLETVERHLAQALVLDPRFAPAKARLAEVYRRTDGCSERGLIHVRGARVLHPDFPLYALKEAQLLLACGKVEDARAIARRLVDEAADSESGFEHNRLCWNGSLWGFAADVLPACERAVAASPESYSIRDSRAVARALTGDLAGAAADLRAALALAAEGRWSEETKARRAAWLRALDNGENPFAGDGLAKLRDDPAEAGLGWWL